MDLVRTLFREYQDFLEVDLCFQDFEQELATLPGKYAAPEGAIWIAWRGAEAAGCIAVRPIEPTVCEMKRLFVRDRYRGYGIGAMLAEASVEMARECGYLYMRLDTLSELEAALKLYHSMGFEPIDPYYHNPLGSVVYLQKSLSTGDGRT
jgi:ribosomal protein S18 acetylase RimI-like enzyme